jgi:hypothetical protein
MAYLSMSADMKKRALQLLGNCPKLLMSLVCHPKALTVGQETTKPMAALIHHPSFVAGNVYSRLNDIVSELYLDEIGTWSVLHHEVQILTTALHGQSAGLGG